MNAEKRFLNVNDVMELTRLSETSSYKLIRQLNEELERKGFLTIRVRIVNTYFFERFFGKEVQSNARIQR